MATDINHVILVGRLTRDAELKYTANGQAVCNFSIAVNRPKRSGDQWVDEANFFDIALWGRQGEALNQYLLKGKMVGVDGSLRQDKWEQDGQTRSKVVIVANNLQLLGGSPGGAAGGSSGAGSYGNGNSGGQGPGSARNGSREAPPPAEGSPEGGNDGFADDIPF
ncbi:single-stranded DNA-binding protein [Spirochaetia bacterium]|nr:single-stranded DNA-binding protein [Spirochaetia bacterium]